MPAGTRDETSDVSDRRVAAIDTYVTSTLERDTKRDKKNGAPRTSATDPTDIPPKGWLQAAKRLKAEAKQDNVALLAGGVAFFALLALVPTFVAALAIWGLFAAPADAQRLIGDIASALPQSAERLLNQQLGDIVSRSNGSLGITAAITLAVALWGASSGMKHLMEAVNTAYDEEETRGFFKVRGMALLFTLGGIAFLLTTVVLIAVLPTAIDETGLGDAARIAVQVIAWPVLAVLMMLGLAVIYRYAPDRRDPEWQWVSPGAIFATVVWLAASALFAVYAANFGDYDKTYGSLGGVVVLMMWLFITATVIILGAELNAALEEQTAHDASDGEKK